jgi:uncharacterized membrane protein YgcG
MKFLASLAAVAAIMASTATAQSSNESICDKYTTALLKNNTAENQLTVLTLVVNTALIGNYSNATGPAKNEVTGILNKGTVNGTSVNLLPYFDGSLASSNRNGAATAVNFLDGGGAAPLLMNMAAFSNATSSNQYALVTHLYELFGSLLGCSQQGPSSAFKSYEGNPSMSEVHRFMNLNRSEMNYFIQEVGKAATSFGVSTADATAVGSALNTAFNFRCSPPSALGAGLANASQSVCVAPDCPLAENSDCAQSGDSYGNGTSGVEPKEASTSSSGGSSGSGSSGSGSSGSGSSGTSGTSSAAALFINAVGVLAIGAAGAIAVSL